MKHTIFYRTQLGKATETGTETWIWPSRGWNLDAFRWDQSSQRPNVVYIYIVIWKDDERARKLCFFFGPAVAIPFAVTVSVVVLSLARIEMDPWMDPVLSSHLLRIYTILSTEYAITSIQIPATVSDRVCCMPINWCSTRHPRGCN